MNAEQTDRQTAKRPRWLTAAEWRLQMDWLRFDAARGLRWLANRLDGNR